MKGQVDQKEGNEEFFQLENWLFFVAVERVSKIGREKRAATNRRADENRYKEEGNLGKRTGDFFQMKGFLYGAHSSLWCIRMSEVLRKSTTRHVEVLMKI